VQREKFAILVFRGHGLVALSKLSPILELLCTHATVRVVGALFVPCFSLFLALLCAAAITVIVRNGKEMGSRAFVSIRAK
jgi:hypothetical protein